MSDVFIGPKRGTNAKTFRPLESRKPLHICVHSRFARGHLHLVVKLPGGAMTARRQYTTWIRLLTSRIAFDIGGSKKGAPLTDENGNRTNFMNPTVLPTTLLESRPLEICQSTYPTVGGGDGNRHAGERIPTVFTDWISRSNLSPNISNMELISELNVWTIHVEQVLLSPELENKRKKIW